MYAIILRFCTLLVGLCALIHGLTIPVAHDHSLTSRQDAYTTRPGIADLGSRGLKPGKPIAVPNKPPAGNPAKPGKPIAVPDKQPAGKHTKPTPASAIATASASAKPVAPVNYQYIPRLTKAIDVCDFSGFECSDEDNEPGYSAPGKAPKSGKFAKPGKVVKRAPPTPYRGQPGDSRQYTVNLKPNALILKSKAYWTGPDLYVDTITGLKLKKTYANFKTDNIKTVDAFRVHTTATKPAGVDFVTEHILELQTVKKFIESVTQTEDEDNPKLIKLRKTIAGEWFVNEWNKQHPAEVQNRPAPLPSYPRPSNPRDESINDIVFEALGSKTNAEDFILCVKSINSAKGRLWSNQNPFNPSELKKDFKLAAAGALDTAEPMSVIRTVLAVYEYMELKEVKDRLQNEIKNVKIELSMDKIKHIVGTNNLPKDDVKKETVDLAKMWEEYMVRHILRFERKGVDWLDDQLKPALVAYQAELKSAEEAKNKMAKEKADQKAAELDKARTTKIQELQRNTRALSRDLWRAKTRVDNEEKKFQDIKTKVDALPQAQRDAERGRLKFYQQVAQKSSAAKVWFDKRVELGRAEREIAGFDEQQLPKLVKQLSDDVAQIEAFQAVVKKMDDDLKEREALVDLGNISIGDK